MPEKRISGLAEQECQNNPIVKTEIVSLERWNELQDYIHEATTFSKGKNPELNELLDLASRTVIIYLSHGTNWLRRHGLDRYLKIVQDEKLKGYVLTPQDGFGVEQNKIVQADQDGNKRVTGIIIRIRKQSQTAV